jgi:hypothetical protein
MSKSTLVVRPAARCVAVRLLCAALLAACACVGWAWCGSTLGPDNIAMPGAYLLMLALAAGLAIDASLARFTVHDDAVEIRRLTGSDIYIRNREPVGPGFRAILEAWRMSLRQGDLDQIATVPSVTYSPGSRRPPGANYVIVWLVFIAATAEAVRSTYQELLGALWLAPSIAVLGARLMGYRLRREVPIKGPIFFFGAVYLAAVLLSLVATDSMQVDSWQNGAAVAALTALAAVALIGAAYGWDTALRWTSWSIVLVVSVGMVYAFNAVLQANAMWDRSRTTQPVPVVTKWLQHGGKSSAFLVRVAPWGPVAAPEDLLVDRTLYDSLRPGDALCGEAGRGAFGVAWHIVHPCRAGHTPAETMPHAAGAGRESSPDRNRKWRRRVSSTNGVQTAWTKWWRMRKCHSRLERL